MVFKRFSWRTFPVAWALMLVAGSAFAQENKAAAEALFAEGRAAMDASDYDTACSKFAESGRLDPAVGTQLNLANCEEQRGKLATAWRMFRSLAERIPAIDPRRPVAEERVRDLDRRVPRLRISSTSALPAGTRVRIGAVELTNDGFGSPIPLDPGEHVVTVFVPGKKELRRFVRLEPGSLVEVAVPTDDGPASSSPQARTEPDQVSPRASDDFMGVDRDVATYGAFGIGAAGLLVGSITGLIGLQKESVADSNCDDATQTCNQRGFDANAASRTMATVSTIGFVVSLAGVGAGTYLVVSQSTDSAGGNRAAAIQWRGAW